MKRKEERVGETASETWDNCYRGGWQGLLVPDAFAHP